MVYCLEHTRKKKSSQISIQQIFITQNCTHTLGRVYQEQTNKDRAVKLPWIFLGAPLTFNGASRNIQGNVNKNGGGVGDECYLSKTCLEDSTAMEHSPYFTLATRGNYIQFSSLSLEESAANTVSGKDPSIALVSRLLYLHWLWTGDTTILHWAI